MNIHNLNPLDLYPYLDLDPYNELTYNDDDSDQFNWLPQTTLQDSAIEHDLYAESPKSSAKNENPIQEDKNSIYSLSDFFFAGKLRENEEIENPSIHPHCNILPNPEIKHSFNTNDNQQNDQQIPPTKKKRHISRRQNTTKNSDNMLQMKIDWLRSKGKEKEAEKAEKNLMRLRKNRQSARNSRKRKRLYAEQLENKVGQLEKEISRLKSDMTAQNSENEVLKAQVVCLMQQALPLIPKLLPNLNVSMLSQDPLAAASQLSHIFKENPFSEY